MVAKVNGTPTAEIANLATSAAETTCSEQASGAVDRTLTLIVLVSLTAHTACALASAKLTRSSCIISRKIGTTPASTACQRCAIEPLTMSVSAQHASN